jgi:flagellin
MVISHNIEAQNAARMLGITQTAQAKTIERLSSGYKINRSADDAAGLQISEKVRREINGLSQASSNAGDGISCAQTAEGAMSEVTDMLQRMNELAIKSANGTLSDDDRTDIQDEMDQLKSEIDRVGKSTKFNEIYLMQGDRDTGAGQSISIHAGADSDSNDKITFTLEKMNSKSLGVDGVDVTTQSGATDAIDTVYDALKTVSKQRSRLGAVQNRLDYTQGNLDNIVENENAADSQLRDTDMASSIMEFSKNRIAELAGYTMLSNASKSGVGMLSLFA